MESSKQYARDLKRGEGRMPVSGKSRLTTSMKLLFILFIFLAAAGTGLHAQDASLLRIDTGDIWRYFKGPAAPPENWASPDFDDSGWMQGPAAFGYGPGNYMTFLSDMQGSYRRVYARREFTIGNSRSITRMTLSIDCDASFAAFINGIEVIRNDVPLDEELDISGFIHELHTGRNIIAVRCDDEAGESSSFSFNPVFEVLYE